MKTKLKLISVVFCMAFTLYCAVTYITGCTTPQVVTNPDGSISTNHVVDPKVLAALAAAEAANAATAPVNPFTLPIQLGLGSAAALLAWFAKYKNDKAAASQLLLKTVINAVDALDDQKVKDSIQAHAISVGTEEKLNTEVQRVGSGLS